MTWRSRPDQKYLLVAGGQAALEIYLLAQPEKALVEILGHRGDWIAWTRQGYYAGTPGGERLMGWRVITDPDKPAVFYPAQTFHKQFYRPDVIERLLPEGSVEAALKKTVTQSAAAANVEDALPPTVRIVSAQRDPTDAQKWIIKAEALPAAPGQKVDKLRLMVDDRPLPEADARRCLGGWTASRVRGVGGLEDAGRQRGAEGAACNARRLWSVRSETSSRGAGRLKDRPALHLLSIGIDYASDADLKLTCPPNDAQDIAKSLPAACVGPKNQFGLAGEQHLLLNGKATAATIRDSLQAIRKKVKPRDLVVFFYAGHGVRDNGQFYLLTAGANPKMLAKTALSGADLRRAFTDFPCQVVLMLDACHSGGIAKALRDSVTDDAARALADEECGVTLIAAAMGHERALEPLDGKNGLFTRALLDALERKDDVTFNRFDGRQYIHHLFGEVLDQVQATSHDTQHPCLSMPWTMESFPVRQLREPKKQ